MNRDRLFAVIISSKAVIPERSAWRPSGRHRCWMHGGKSPGGPLIRPLRQLAVVPEGVGVGAHGPCVQSNDQLVLCRYRTRHRAERASLGDFAEQLACAFRQSTALPHNASRLSDCSAPFRRAARMACQMRSGVAGNSICSTPNSASASTIAFATAASPGVIPPSLPPRMPSNESPRNEESASPSGKLFG